MYNTWTSTLLINPSEKHEAINTRFRGDLKIPLNLRFTTIVIFYSQWIFYIRNCSEQFKSLISYVNPNGVGGTLHCARTFFRWQFLPEKRSGGFFLHFSWFILTLILLTWCSINTPCRCVFVRHRVFSVLADG